MASKEYQVVDAACVYLLLRDEYRISRNVRTEWYLQHLNKAVKWSASSNSTSEETGLHVLSIVAYKKHVFGLPTHYNITPNTRLVCLSDHYKLVFVLDISPSAATLDEPGGQVLYAEAFSNLQTTLTALVKPFDVEECSERQTPTLHTTIIAHTPLLSCQANQVLVQGCVVTEENVDAVLDLVWRRLECLEQRVSVSMLPLLSQRTSETDESITFGLFLDTGSESRDSLDGHAHMTSPDMCFINMLRYAMLSLYLLPDHSSAGIIVITDGLVAMPDPSLYDSVMTQLRHQGIACSFILNGNEFHECMAFGHVPHTELLQFIANSTFGAYFEKMPVLDTGETTSYEMNVLQKALLTWSSHQVFLNLAQRTSDEAASRLRSVVYVPHIRKHVHEKTLPLRAASIVFCRLLEGYAVKNVKLKGQNQVEVVMVLPWRDYAHVHYTITCAWPFDAVAKGQCKVELAIEGSYDFLHDVTCTQKPIKSPYRQVQIRCYWKMIEWIEDSDQRLLHLQSFHNTPGSQTVPEALRHGGIALFTQTTSSSRPRLNSQLHGKDSVVDQCAEYWKPLLLDSFFWAKCLHTHNISLVLEHDHPLGRHVIIPNANGRHDAVSCREALQTVTDFLQRYSSLMLVAAHTYAKLLYSEANPDQPPVSWCLIRLVSQSPCYVVRLAFLGGTPGKQRKKVMHEIAGGLGELYLYARRETQKQATDESNDVMSDVPEAHLPPLPKPRSSVKSCQVLSKPVEKILVRYERVPSEFGSLEVSVERPSPEISIQACVNRASSSLLNTLSRYLHRRRWIWAVQHGRQRNAISTQAVGRILNTLIKIRLQEGYHFAQTNLGMVNLILQVEMKTPSDIEEEEREDVTSYPCLVQYLLFPPHSSTHPDPDSQGVEGVGEASAEADVELQIISECWVEPQYGQVIKSAPERRHLDGITYSQLPQAMFPVDLECISTMITFEHLNLMCHSKTVELPSRHILPGPGTPVPPSVDEQGAFISPLSSQSQLTAVANASRQDSHVQEVAFPFDLKRVITKCQQAELCYSTFVQDLMSAELPATLSALCDDDVIDDVAGHMTGSSNQLLMSQFLDYLSGLHDREISLSATDCRELMQLLRQRERDTESHPLPFKYGEVKNISPDEVGCTPCNPFEENRSRRNSLDLLSVRSQYSSYSRESNGKQPNASGLRRRNSRPFALQASGRSNTNIQSFFHQQTEATSSADDADGRNPRVSLLGSINAGIPRQIKLNNSTGIGAMSQSGTPSGQQGSFHWGERQSTILETDKTKTIDDFEAVPRWRCFIKAVTSTHIMLTFIPAQYNHVLLLSENIDGMQALINRKEQAKRAEMEKQKEKDLLKKTASTRLRRKVELESRMSHSSPGLASDKSFTSPRSTTQTTESKFLTKSASANILLDKKSSTQGLSRSFEEQTYPLEDDLKTKSLNDVATKERENDDVDAKLEECRESRHKSIPPGFTESHALFKEESVSSEPANLHRESSTLSDVLPATSSSSNQVRDNRESAPIPSPKADDILNQSTMRSLTLPVYVYNCPLSLLTEQLVNRWTFKRPADYFKDLRFSEIVAQHDTTGSNSAGDASFTVGEEGRKRRKTYSGDGERRHPVDSGIDHMTGHCDNELEKHCAIITDTFLRSFVNCVFRGITLGMEINRCDVESAVNCFCVELLPIQIDITQFLTTSCAHTRQVIEEANYIALVQEDRRNTFMSDIRCPLEAFDSCDDQRQSDPAKTDPDDSDTGAPGGGRRREGTEGEGRKGSIGAGPLSPEDRSQAEVHPKSTGGSPDDDFAAPHFPSSSTHSTSAGKEPKLTGTARGSFSRGQGNAVHFPLQLLQGSIPCERPGTSGMHALIKKKFGEALAKCFKQIPSCPDYFILSPPDERKQNQDCDHSEMSGNESSFLASPSKDPASFADDDLSDLESDTSSLDADVDIFDDATQTPTNENAWPLFVHPMCTVRCGRTLKSTPAREIQTCFGELQECFDKSCKELDLSDLQITLDLICLTLPPETDVTETAKRPGYRRFASYCSQMSHSRASSTSEADDLVSMQATTDFGSKMEESLSILPARHRQILANWKDDTEWLLRDEYVSLTRLLTPVTVTTLQTVAHHVHNSCLRSEQRRERGGLAGLVDVPAVDTVRLPLELTRASEEAVGQREELMVRQMARSVYKQVKLQYVYGETHSHLHFVQRFERLNHPQYRLNKEGSYYYLCHDSSTDYTSRELQSSQAPPPHVLTHKLAALKQQHSPSQQPSPRQTPVTSAPSNLLQQQPSHGDSAARAKNIVSPTEKESGHFEVGFREDHFALSEREDSVGSLKEAQPTSTPPNKQSLQHGKTQTPTPGSPEKTLRRQKAIEDPTISSFNSPDDAKLTAKRNLTSLFSDGGPPSEDQRRPARESRGMQIDPEADDPNGTLIEYNVNREEKEADIDGTKFLRRNLEDVRISVTRPSPVRELAPLHIDTDFGEDGSREQGRRSHATSSLDREDPTLPRQISDEVFEKSGRALPLFSDLATHTEPRGIAFPPDVQKMDAISKSVHFLQHQSPDTRSPILSAEQLQHLQEEQERVLQELHTAKARDGASTAPSVFMSADVLHRQPVSCQSITSVLSFPGACQQSLKPTSLLSSTVSLLSQDSSIRRAHSSASFEKYRTEAEHRGLMGRSMSAKATPSRSRHHSGKSGPLTPISSMFDISSRSSYGEEGYDGDASDPEDGTSMFSYGYAHMLKAALPDFWFILKVDPQCVHIFYHARANDDKEKQACETKLLLEITQQIQQVCHGVNQMLLLEELYASRVCNKLLVPEADEDVRWKPQPEASKTSQPSDSDDSDDEEVGAPSYLATSMWRLEEGHFACPEVWHCHFPLHPRLKAHKHGISSGISSMKNVLQNISVQNRSNMFVYKENNTGNVFYLRLQEGANLDPPVAHTGAQGGTDQHGAIGRITEEDTQISRSSSQQFIATTSTLTAVTRPAGGATEVTEETELGVPGLTASVRANKPDHGVNLLAYGICDVGSEISKDLVVALQKRLDDAVLKLMHDLLVRNRMCKLMSEDVQFIQTAGSAPTATVYATIPSSVMLQQYAFGCYLRQHLLHFLTTPQTATFIQPAGSAPTATVHATIPSSVMLQQYAFGCYLRQHLLHFLFRPNYSGAGDQRFRDYTAPDFPMIPDEDAFLYNRPQQSGGNGLACIHLLFVNNKRQPLKLLGSCKPPVNHCEDIETKIFANLVNTRLYNCETDSPYDGPLVKFHIWGRGDIGLEQLSRELLGAVQNALCDVITEYRVLPATLCEVPAHYTRGMDSPLHSAPVSHKILAEDEVEGEIRCNSDVNSMSTEGSIIKAKSAFSIQNIFSDFFRLPGSTSKDVEKDELGESDAIPSGELRLHEKIAQYEAGEKGILHPVYAQAALPWFEFCHQKGCVSVQSTLLTLTNLFALHYTMKEIQRTVGELSPDTSVRIFRCVRARCQGVQHAVAKATELATNQSEDEKDSQDGGTLEGSPACHKECAYELCNMLSKEHSVDDQDRSGSDLEHVSCIGVGNSGGGSGHFMIVCRNVQQWRNSLQTSTSDDENATGSSVAGSLQQSHELPIKTKGGKSLERFPALGAADVDKGEGSLVSRKSAVPRQRLMLVEVCDRQLRIFAYNWAADAYATLEKQLSRAVLWHNARSYLLTCLLSQKLGLYQHALMHKESPALAKMPKNPFLTKTLETEHLVRYTSAQHMSQLLYGRALPRSNTTALKARGPQGPASPLLASPLSLAIPGICFDELYLNTQPAVPMQSKDYGAMRDPLHRHGMQMLLLRQSQKQKWERLEQLGEVFFTWEQRGQAHMPITAEQLQVLQLSSRLLHTVASPLLFSTAWRQSILGTRATRLQNTTSVVATVLRQPRSRHGSGSSLRSRRSNSIGEKPVDSPDVGGQKAPTATAPTPTEEPWHAKLRASFLQQYIEYIGRHGFTRVSLRPATSAVKRTGSFSRPVLSTERKEEGPQDGSLFLQKTLAGGILLIQIGFREAHFCVEVYVLDCSKIPELAANINPRKALFFIEECDNLKDMTHAHSFTHDFHLRILQTHLLRPRDSLLPSNYHVAAFLRDFVKHYVDLPLFAINYVLEGALCVDKTSTAGPQLFDYITRHQNQFHMVPVAMSILPDDEMFCDADRETALLSHSESKIATDDEEQKYTALVLVTHDPPLGCKNFDAERSALYLRYWVVMTHQTQCFPVHRRMGRKVRTHATVTANPMTRFCQSASGYEELSAADPTSPRPVAREPPRQQLCMHQGAPCLRSTPPTHQTPVYTELLKLSDQYRDTIFKMVELSMAHCRRDILWQSMLLPTNASDDPNAPAGGGSSNVGIGTRRKHRSGWLPSSSPPPSLEPDRPQPSTFTEFACLLTMVELVRLEKSRVFLLQKHLTISLPSTFTEFACLLTMVERVPLEQIDPQLQPLQAMPVMWYMGLKAVLINKFREHHRQYVRADQQVQYLVIVNNFYPDTFLLLSINKIFDKGEISIVFKSTGGEDPVTSATTPTTLPDRNYFLSRGGSTSGTRFRHASLIDEEDPSFSGGNESSVEVSPYATRAVHFSDLSSPPPPPPLTLTSLLSPRGVPGGLGVGGRRGFRSCLDDNDAFFLGSRAMSLGGSDLQKPRLQIMNVQYFLREFVNVCCYHLWASILQ